jgi:hypothetical protein
MRILRQYVCYATGIAAAGVIALAMCVEAERAQGQDQNADITGYLKQHQQELRLTNGQLNGPAARWLCEEASKAQFLFIGEEHDTREIPLILTALWPKLAPLGYRHVAIEAGQWLGGRLDRFARFSDRSALEQFKAAAFPRRRGVGVPPSSDEDLAFYASLGRPQRPGASAREPLIWGLDHEFKVTPLLKRLSELTNDAAKRRQVAALLTKVESAEHAGAYNMQPFKSEITSLIRVFAARPGAELAQLLDALERRVYGNRYDQERGDVFKQLFLRYYRAAQSAGEAHPRVLLRFGSYHAKRGQMVDYGTSTLANFVAETAFAEGADMLNVMFIACADPTTTKPGNHPRPCEPREWLWLQPFSAVTADAWTLFDLRGLREQMRAGKLNVGWELWQIIAGFDAVVLLKESAPARFSP